MKQFFTLTFLLTCCFLVRQDLHAQDPYLAQHYAAPLQMNPAHAGVFEGSWRAVLNYRQQWNIVLGRNPFRTMGASWDKRSRVGRNDYIAYGINVLHDEVGMGNLTQDKGYLNLSFMKQLDGGRYRRSDQYLVAGVQGGFGQMALDFGGLWFSTQFDGATETIDPSLDNQEALVMDQTNLYLDLNAGLMWYAVFDKNQSIYAGGALHHVNAPTVSFFDQNNTLEMKWVAQIGGEFPMTRELSMLPSLLVMGQGPSLLTLFGGNFRYSNRDWREIAIRAGAFGQIGKNPTSAGWNNLIATAVLEMERIQLGFSYDINTGKVAEPTNARGGFEISLIYVHPEKSRYKTRCPKF